MSGAISIGSIADHMLVSVNPQWTPASISSLRGWYGARLETGLSSGNNATFTDRSGYGNNLTGQGTVVPTWITGVINGHPVYRFNGNDGFAEGTSLSGIANWTQGPFTVFIVIRLDTTLEEDIIGSGTSGAGHMLLMVVDNAGPDVVRAHAWREAANANAINGATTISTATNYLVGQRVTSTQIEAFLNGASDVGPTNLAGLAETGPSTFSVGGSTGRGTSRCDGDIAEALFYTSALSDADMNRVEAYLNSIYAIY